MKLISAYKKLKNIGQPVFQTCNAAIILGLSPIHTSKLLGRLVAEELMIHLKRGLWGFPEAIDPLKLPEYLTAPFPSYISLQTALFNHDMISQIPSVIYAVSLARSEVIKTDLAVVSIHHVTPDFFFGYEIDAKAGIKIASPEKAIVDYFYFKPAKSKLFSSHPEIELPECFDLKKAKEFLTKIKSESRRTMATKLLEELVKHQGK